MPVGSANAPESDERLVLAYDAAVAALDTQEDTLSNLRNRATTIISTSALVASFSATAGLLNTDVSQGQTVPVEARVTLFLLLVVIATLCMVVLWPVRNWSFGPDARQILAKVNEDVRVDAIRAFVVEALLEGRSRNSKALQLKHRCYQSAVLALVLEASVVLGSYLR